jgi:hypothetical protein
MAQTVIEAFNEFLKETVNLDPEQTKKARASRDWLFGQIASFQNDAAFPQSYPEFDINFGSFARRTKKRPLDDIDMMICLSGQGGYYTEYVDKITITVDSESNLKPFCNDLTNTLNSKKVINKFIRKCEAVPQYSKADLKRNGAAAVLSLQSYDWCFDIVPCFITTADSSGCTYYLIPDGNGNWKKTDPRIDRDRIKEINKFHDGNVLNVIRIIKYWNRRATMPSMGSYFLETMILDYYASRSETDKASKYVDIEIPRVLQYIAGHIYLDVFDPKGIRGNINDVPWEDRVKIAERATLDKQKADAARSFEDSSDHKSSIQKWREVFGEEFPNYE